MRNVMKIVTASIFALCALVSFGDVTVMASRAYVNARTTLHPVTNNGEVVGYNVGIQTNIVLVTTNGVCAIVTNNVKSTDFGPWLTGYTYSSNSSFLTLDSVRWNGEYWEVHIVGSYQDENINGWYPASQTDETPTETYTTTNKNVNATVLSSLRPPFDQQVCQALTTRRSMGGDYNALGLAYLRNISPTDTIFSNAVLAVGLGVDTNTVAQINEILVEAGESSIGPISSAGGLIVAVVVAIAWLKRKKLDLSAVGSEWVESTTYGIGDNVVYEGKFYVSKAASNQGHKPTDTTWWDVSTLFAAIAWLKKNKADKVSSATSGNLSALDADGNLTDSGKNADSFDAAGSATSAVTAHNAATDAHADLFALRATVADLGNGAFRISDNVVDTTSTRVLY